MRSIKTLRIGDIQLTWLNGGDITLDGGSMFGVVPKKVWSRKYPCDEMNLIKMVADPILVQAKGKNFLIDSGLGSNKLTDLHKKFLGVTRESLVEEQLFKLGLSTDDIHGMLMTHLHNDHAAGLTMKEKENYVPVFKNATHYIQATEWDEMREPNIRSRGTYIKENWQPIQSLVETFKDQVQILEGIELIHTGGHTAGHVIIRMESQGQVAYHLADILPSHVHQNPLWVMAYDDYPMDSIFAKERWIQQAVNEKAWLTFYHDYFVRAIQWDQDGNVVNKIENEHD